MTRLSSAAIPAASDRVRSSDGFMAQRVAARRGQDGGRGRAGGAGALGGARARPRALSGLPGWGGGGPPPGLGGPGLPPGGAPGGGRVAFGRAGGPPFFGPPRRREHRVGPAV